MRILKLILAATIFLSCSSTNERNNQTLNSDAAELTKRAKEIIEKEISNDLIDSSLRLINEALQINPDHLDALIWKTNLLSRNPSANFDTLLKINQHIQSVEPNNPYWVWQAGLIYMYSDYKKSAVLKGKALEMYSEQLNKKYDSVMAIEYASLTHSIKGKSKAIKLIDSLLIAHPDDERLRRLQNDIKKNDIF